MSTCTLWCSIPEGATLAEQLSNIPQIVPDLEISITQLHQKSNCQGQCAYDASTFC